MDSQPDELTHLAHDRLAPGGAPVRACDGGPLAPLPIGYELNDNSGDRPDICLVFCPACLLKVRAVAKSR